MTGRELLPLPVGEPVVHRLTVTNRGSGNGEHSGAERMGSPAQVEVLTQNTDGGIETAERGEEVGSYELDASRGDEHVTDVVVLLLVELTPFDLVDQHPEPIGSHADLEEAAVVVPRDRLRAGDTGVLAVELAHQRRHARLVEDHVVVAEQQERRPGHQLDRLVGGHAPTGVTGQAVQVSLREDLGHTVPRSARRYRHR